MNNLVRNDPLDDFFRGFFVRPVEFGQAGEAPAIKVDVKENAEGYTIHAELPGVRKEDIHVSIDGPVVAISAEKQEQKEVKEGERVLRTERRFGKVSRSLQLGQELDEARATAKYSDGILELTLPRKEATQAKRLTID